MIYQFESWSRVKGDAQKIGEEFERLNKRNRLTADDVVAEASNPKHFMHNQFEWDDSKAAHEYRLTQARYLIRSIVRVEDEDVQPVRAFVKLSDEDQYDSVVHVLTEAQRRQRLYADVSAMISGLRRKMQSFQDLHDLIEMLEYVDLSMQERVGAGRGTSP